LFGLLTFAIPNFLGLLIFGLVTHHLARREPGSESLAKFFASWSRPFRLVFFLYQILAITLTIFAFIRYGWAPLGFRPELLYLPLTMLVVLAAAILFGEEFDIKRIKWSHGALFLLLAPALVILPPCTLLARAQDRSPSQNFQRSELELLGDTPSQSSSAFWLDPGWTSNSGSAPSRCTANASPSLRDISSARSCFSDLFCGTG
jgi:hypothetical protein